MSYYVPINDYLEDLTCDLLNPLLQGYQLERNNRGSNAIDLRIIDHQQQILATMDVQYSMSFARYGDVRIDLMSAGWLKSAVENQRVFEINRQIARSANHLATFKSFFDIQKYGKYFAREAKNMLGVFYYFYNDKFDKTLENIRKHAVDYYFFLPYSVVLNEVRHNPNIEIKVNDKQANQIYEDHYSAFACLNVRDLCQKYQLPLYTSIDKLHLDFASYFTQELDNFNRG